MPNRRTHRRAKLSCAGTGACPAFRVGIQVHHGVPQLMYHRAPAGACCHSNNALPLGAVIRTLARCSAPIRTHGTRGAWSLLRARPRLLRVSPCNPGDERKPCPSVHSPAAWEAATGNPAAHVARVPCNYAKNANDLPRRCSQLAG